MYPPKTPTHLPKHLIGFSTKTYFDLPQTTTYICDLLPSLSSSSIISSSLSFPSADPSSTSTDTSNGITLFILPSFPALYPANEVLIHHHNQPPSNHNASNTINDNGLDIWLGAQNTHTHHGSPPLTGEVSPLILSQVGCKIVCVGHAERRAPPSSSSRPSPASDGLKSIYESNLLVAKKAKAVVDAGMVPLVCIGEYSPPPPESSALGSGSAVEEAMYECVVQVRPVLDLVWGVPDTEIRAEGEEDGEGAVEEKAGVVFAYEPVWAIGAAEPATAGHICGVVAALKAWVHDRYASGSEPTSQKGRGGETRWLYGGSAGPGVWGRLQGGHGESVGEGEGDGKGDVVDGLFLGRFAHKVEGFVGVVEDVVGTLGGEEG